MYIESNANHQNLQNIQNRSKCGMQPSLLHVHDKLHVTEKIFEYVVLFLSIYTKGILVKFPPFMNFAASMPHIQVIFCIFISVYSLREKT